MTATNENGSFAGRVAFVTGAGSGMGRTIAPAVAALLEKWIKGRPADDFVFTSRTGRPAVAASRERALFEPPSPAGERAHRN